MFKEIFFLLTLLLFSSRPAIAEDANPVSKLLKAADAFRLSGDAMRVETEIRLFKSGKLDKERSYTVFIKAGRRSLVLFRHPSERGQKLLMRDDKFWIIMPKSRRPIRITPMQKLLGDASSGDIATLTWHEDYKGVIAGKVVVDGVPSLHLKLLASRKGVTYKGIDLFLAQDDHRPIKAELYVASGKLAKVARFTIEEMNGRPQVVLMTLSDHIQNKRLTEVRYREISAESIPDKIYNPMYLIRNDLSDW